MGQLLGLTWLGIGKCSSLFLYSATLHRHDFDASYFNTSMQEQQRLHHFLPAHKATLRA